METIKLANQSAYAVTIDGLSQLAVKSFQLTDFAFNSLFQLVLFLELPKLPHHQPDVLIGRTALFTLFQGDGLWAIEGEVSRFTLTDTDPWVGCPRSQRHWMYQLVITPPLARLQQCRHYNLFTNTSISVIFKQLFQRHGITHVQYAFSDKIHPFELQYGQSDFELFTRLVVQYGLTYFYTTTSQGLQLIITDKPVKGTHHDFTENTTTGMHHDQEAAYDVMLSSQRLPKGVRFRAEATDASRIQYVSYQGQASSLKREPFHDVFELYACSSQKACEEFGHYFFGQLQWQRQLLYFKTPLMNLVPGDTVSIQQPRDPRIRETYQIIYVAKQGSEIQTPYETSKTDYQAVIAIRLSTPFYPLHPLNQPAIDPVPKPLPHAPSPQLFQATHPAPLPSLILGTIDGSPHEPAVDETGCYRVRLWLNRETVTPPLRLMQPYAGPPTSERSGFHFPLHGDTDVVLSCLNQNPQQLIILGAFTHDKQPDAVTSTNAHQHIMQTHQGLGMCFDDKTQTLSLYTKGKKQRCDIGIPEGMAEGIRLLTDTGELEIYAKEGIHLHIKENYHSHAKTQRNRIGGDFFLKSQDLQLEAGKAIHIESQLTQSLKAKTLELNSTHLKAHAKGKQAWQAHQHLHIKTNTLRIDAGTHAAIKATQSLQLAIGDKHLRFTDTGQLELTHPLTVHSKTINHHQTHALNSGATAQFDDTAVKAALRNAVKGIPLFNRPRPQQPTTMVDVPLSSVNFYRHQPELYQQHARYPKKMPPVIINLHDAMWDESLGVTRFKTRQDKHARAFLSLAELNYFKEQGDNVTLFIHGFNVPYGAFSKQITKVSMDLTSYPHALQMSSDHFNRLLVDHSDELSTYYQDPASLMTEIPLAHRDEKQLGEINGRGMHEWVIYFERAMNEAANTASQRNAFQRCLFIAWPGEPPSPADYMEAANRSREFGPIVAELIKEIKAFSPSMQINMVAHSQGNGVMLKALEHLGRTSNVQVDHCYFWDAAIPASSLSPEPPAIPSPWYSPNAHKAAQYFRVLFSRNDNILGPLISAKEQPPGVDIKQVYQRKPDAELFASCLCSYLGLKSLYLAANALGLPASLLLESNHIDHAWQQWRQCYPEQAAQFAPTLEAQLKRYGENNLIRHFCQTLAARVKQNRPQIDATLSYLDHHRLVLNWMFNVLSKGEALAEFLFDPLERTLAILGKQQPEPALIASRLPWLKKAITFIFAVEFEANLPVEDAMGYKGVDDTTMDFFSLKEISFKNIDTTRWVYHHSDMKAPSQAILREIYTDRIVDSKGYQFGFHTGRKEIR